MTMLFRTIKDRLVTILGDNASGQYQVAGYQNARQGANNSRLEDRTVRVFYKNGSMSRSASSADGPIHHEMTFDVEITVSAPASIDTTVLNDPTATAGEKATALAQARYASDIADMKFDEIADRVYQVLMDNRYQAFDTSDDLDGSLDLAVGDRWIGQIEKDAPSANGQLVTITGAMTLQVDAPETLLGAAALATDVDGAGVEIALPIHDEGGNTDQDNLRVAVD